MAIVLLHRKIHRLYFNLAKSLLHQEPWLGYIFFLSTTSCAVDLTDSFQLLSKTCFLLLFPTSPLHPLGSLPLRLSTIPCSVPHLSPFISWRLVPTQAWCRNGRLMDQHLMLCSRSLPKEKWQRERRGVEERVNILLGMTHCCSWSILPGVSLAMCI